MSAAHLHAVPDPDEDGPLDEPTVPLPAPAAPAALVDDEDQADEETAGEEPERRRALAVPDLRPYVDVRALAELGPFAVEVGRHNGPALLRGLRAVLRGLGDALCSAGRFLCVIGRGLAVLATIVAGWLSGSIGKHGSVAARFAGAGFVVYAVVRLSMKYAEIAPWAVGGTLFLAVALAGEGRIAVPGSKSKKTGEEQQEKAGEEQQEKDEEAPQDEPREQQATKKRRGLFSRFRKAAKDTADDETGETGEDAPAAPSEPPLTALLREEIGEENGVHLVDLRPAMREHLPGLSSATDEELRQALTRAGYDPSRKFRARGVAGRAGVHRTQLPPLPSPESGPGALSAPLSTPGERPRPANSPEAESGGEPGGESTESGYSIVQDPEGGPSAWKVQHHRK